MSSYCITLYIWDSTLQDLSNGIKNTQIGVCMTKLWPYEVREKNRGLQQRRDFENQRRDVAAQRRDVRGRFWVDF